jgi:hypothetical protein
MRWCAGLLAMGIKPRPPWRETTPPTDPEKLEQWVLERIGAFIFRLSRLELALRYALGIFLKLPNELLEAVPASYDFRTLCAVTQAAGDVWCRTEVEKEKIRELIKRCYAINDIRNRIVHGTWTVNAMGSAPYRARHMSRQTLKVTEYFRDPAELGQGAYECGQLGTALFRFVGDHALRCRAPV